MRDKEEGGVEVCILRDKKIKLNIKNIYIYTHTHIDKIFVLYIRIRIT